MSVQYRVHSTQQAIHPSLPRNKVKYHLTYINASNPQDLWLIAFFPPKAQNILYEPIILYISKYLWLFFLLDLNVAQLHILFLSVFQKNNQKKVYAAGYFYLS